MPPPSSPEKERKPTLLGKVKTWKEKVSSPASSSPSEAEKRDEKRKKEKEKRERVRRGSYPIVP